MHEGSPWGYYTVLEDAHTACQRELHPSVTLNMNFSGRKSS